MNRARACLIASGALVFAAASPAAAGRMEDQVKRDGILRCAATERPGYAGIEADQPTGRAADLCRAVATTVLGTGGRYALRLLDLDSDFDRVRSGEVELAFLEPRLVSEHDLAALLTPLSEAYQDSFAVLVPQTPAPGRLADLGGQTICFMIGDPVWPMLQDGLAGRDVSFRPFGFSEEVEMKDAYNVGRCAAMAGVASTLDEPRADGGVRHLRSQRITEPLGPDPVFAMVPSGDAEWAEVVRRSIDRELSK